MIIELKEERYILKLIERKKSVNEIKEEMGLSDEEFMTILNRIRTIYKVRFKYYSDGTIQLEKDEKLFKERNVKLNHNFCRSNKKSKKLRIGIISDLHAGSVYERFDFLNQFYQYCKANNIHIVFNGGDLLDGSIGLSEKIYNDPIEQINHLLTRYPFDKSIVNFICLGNHDESLFNSYSLEIDKILINNRIDLIPVSYGYSRIYISDIDFISMVHEGTTVKSLYNKDRDKVILYGHTHQFRIESNESQVNIYIPPLCDIPLNDNICPGFLIANITIEDGLLTRLIIEHHKFKDSLDKKNEFEFRFKGRQLVKK